MTIDHIGVVLYPELTIFRIIGRLAFPIFCYLLILGVKSTRNIKNYFIRLFIFALISQAPYFFAFEYIPFARLLNNFFTLSLGVIFLHSLLTLSLGVMFLRSCLLILIPLLISIFLNFDFGVYGFILLACMRLLDENIMLGTATLVLLGVFSSLIWETQIFSLIALPIILFHRMGYLKIYRTKNVNENTVYPIWRKYFYYAYYPLHLTVLYLIKLSFF